MAAFIQKLFKSRKSPVATEKVRKEAPAPDVPQEDTRANLREAQLETLKGSPGQAELAELAVEGITADIRLEAAGRLTDADCLQQVQKKAKGRDKTVYQTVRQALQKLRDEQARLEGLSQTITTLISHANDQARSDDTKLYEARLGALTRQWAEVEAHANAEQAQSFLEAIHRCNERLEAIQSAQADEDRQKEQLLQREETLNLLAGTLEELQSQAPETLPSLASLDALQKTQENRWLEATRDTSVDKQQQKAYEASMLSLRNYISAVRHSYQEKDTLTELVTAIESGDDVSEEQRELGKRLIREISWPEGFPMPALLDPIRQLAGKRKQPAPDRTEDQEKQRAIAADLEKSMTRLEAALEAKQLKESRQLLKTVQQQFKSLDRRHGKPFQARMQLLNGQMRELSDWLGFATEPKQIELCEQMEYLAEQPMEPEAKAERIKELQNEWRNLGGSSDRALWTRFKAASDKAYEPCKDYFSAKSGLKRANLEKRQAICDELETFLNHADWTNIDWKAAEKIHLTARQEWKAAWPVEFRENRQVQKRFDDLLKKLEAPLDQERQKNEALKQEIVERANALIDHEPLQDAMNQAKNLQSDWKAIGITRHREDRKLWQAFRKACDQIFARRDAQRNEQQQAARAADDAATAVLEETETLGSDNDASTLTDALKRLHDLQVSALSPALKERLQSEKQRLKRAMANQELRANVSAWQSLVMARTTGPADRAEVPGHWPDLAADQNNLDHGELVIRAEILGGIASPDSDQQRRMEIQVQRLAEGMGSSEQAGEGIEELEKLVARWCLQSSDTTPDEALAKRLSDALAALVPG
ncbi:DUF349 domain-containing protein [Marinobacter sp. F4206]|uniref:DUF349 domain-containing protein n=1 Tax=Marinobacter sp. F4206 TaxID=2861777 RepID=UPI001C5F2926|nr:DUF349 domain-containing protein [Marinobacter sp. F4206]MBW4936156.1 DUF349 domain-containing protein [Marinobacter sp. F4206]